MQYHYAPEPTGLDRFAPRVTRILLFLNVVLWLLQQIGPARIGINITDLLGMHYWEADKFAPYQLLSYMFLHSTQGIGHLLNNMFMLWLIGSNIERYWGEQRYILYYLATGLTAALTQQAVWYLDLHQVVAYSDQMVQVANGPVVLGRELLNFPLTVGASGAIFGLLLATGVMFPEEVFVFFPIPVPIKAKYFVVGLGLYELFMGVHSTGSQIAHFAHLGGMIGGGILIYLWRRRHRAY